MNKLLLVIIAILLPPLAVFLKSGAGKDLLINILLCILFWIPGSIGSLLTLTNFGGAVSPQGFYRFSITP
jgi:uncharacterized membrane protein YqaE (UPF0057 family)